MKVLSEEIQNYLSKKVIKIDPFNVQGASELRGNIKRARLSSNFEKNQKILSHLESQNTKVLIGVIEN